MCLFLHDLTMLFTITLNCHCFNMMSFHVWNNWSFLASFMRWKYIILRSHSEYRRLFSIIFTFKWFSCHINGIQCENQHVTLVLSKSFSQSSQGLCYRDKHQRDVTVWGAEQLFHSLGDSFCLQIVSLRHWSDIWLLTCITITTCNGKMLLWFT